MEGCFEVTGEGMKGMRRVFLGDLGEEHCLRRHEIPGIASFRMTASFYFIHPQVYPTTRALKWYLNTSCDGRRVVNDPSSRTARIRTGKSYAIKGRVNLRVGYAWLLSRLGCTAFV